MSTILTDDERQKVFESLPDALEGFMKKWGWLHFAKGIEAALLAKLAQQEPVAWWYMREFEQGLSFAKDQDPHKDWQPLYTHPAPQQAVPDAMKTVIAAMQSDPDYAWSWHCNVAMAFVDAGGDHYTANQGAARFMRLLANVEPAHELPADRQRVPEGWKLVPVDPTERMCKAAADAWLDCHSKMVLNKAGAAAKAAIAAATEAPAQDRTPVKPVREKPRFGPYDDDDDTSHLMGD